MLYAFAFACLCLCLPLPTCLLTYSEWLRFSALDVALRIPRVQNILLLRLIVLHSLSTRSLCSVSKTLYLFAAEDDKVD